ncbi:MAG: guanylate kinase [Acidimicrobiales bacterium]
MPAGAGLGRQPEKGPPGAVLEVLILVVSGPGGAGKGALVDALVRRHPDLWLSRSWTTRPRRPSEVDDAYTFVDRDRFVAEVEAGGLLEWTELPANGHLYGTPWPDPPPGADVVLEIDLDGARQVLDRYPEAVLVLVVAPSAEELASRMRSRGDDEAAIASRLALAVEEERAGRELAHHLVVNDTLGRAVDQVAGILAAHRKPPAGV